MLPERANVGSKISKGSQINDPPLKQRADRYFGENKAYAGLIRASVRNLVTSVAGRGVNVLVQFAVDHPAGPTSQSS